MATVSPGTAVTLVLTEVETGRALSVVSVILIVVA